MRGLSITRQFRNQLHESWMRVALVLVIILPFVIGIGLFLKSRLILQDVSLWELLFSSEWRPLSGKFGFFPFIVSSLWVTVLSLIIAGPICLLTAIHLTQYADNWVLKIMHPVIDILAGIPSVIYGVWGTLVIVPLISNHIAPLFHTDTSGYSILAGGVVLAVMIIPFVLNILIEVFKTIPIELTEASLSVGASKWQTIKLVHIRKAFPGIISAFGLGLSRSFGETIAVLMVVGNVSKIPGGVFEPGYPLPALIANNYGEMLSIPLYDSALMLAAFVLLIVVLLFNLASRILIIRTERYR
ncbi:MAG TPA: phosphate ABC transporter permease subunit PstC [Bacteroidales bacterium]|nr:phosphate ABC transporter permease subunit PstC [Bacteroidales bacterium]HRZ21315.1 phosphate ABC transporter permease subunit PstC [Bacteroidales bacterium]